MYLMKNNELIYNTYSRTIFTKLPIGLKLLIGILILVSRYVIYKHLVA